MTAIATESRLFITHQEGDREVFTAEQLFRDIEQKRKKDSPLPLFISDNWRPFKQAILQVYGTYKKIVSGNRERPRRTRVPLDDLKYAQVCKHRKGYHIVKVTPKIVFGDEQEVLATLLATGGRVINIAYAERLNLSIRNSLARFVRKGQNFSKEISSHTLALDFFQAWYNFVKPHRSLRQPIDHPHRTWQQRTPAMVAGLTNSIWSLEELLTFRRPVQS